MKKHAPPISIARARRMRSEATDAERPMWRLLREFLPQGRWRRQVPIRHYIVDFASLRLKIAIEIDGGQHSAEADARRTADIEAEGYCVVRFWNNEVLGNGEGCMMRLAQRVRPDHPQPASTWQQVAKSSHPSPIKGEGS